MTLVSVISQKGRAGKTTLALHLAVASRTAGRKTAVLDLAPRRLPPIGPTAARPRCRWFGRPTPVACATSCDRYRRPAGRW